MDTDDLSEAAYRCLIEARGIADVLGAEMGAQASSFHTEDEFLEGMIGHIEDIEEDPTDYLESYGIEESLTEREFVRKLGTLKNTIRKTIQTPVAERSHAEELPGDG